MRSSRESEEIGMSVAAAKVRRILDSSGSADVKPRDDVPSTGDDQSLYRAARRKRNEGFYERLEFKQVKPVWESLFEPATKDVTGISLVCSRIGPSGPYGKPEEAGAYWNDPFHVLAMRMDVVKQIKIGSECLRVVFDPTDRSPAHVLIPQINYFSCGAKRKPKPKEHSEEEQDMYAERYAPGKMSAQERQKLEDACNTAIHAMLKEVADFNKSYGPFNANQEAAEAE